MKPKRVIITADDYGLCPVVNRAIEECAQAGGVTAACVIPNMDSREDAASFRKEYPSTSLGLHWNLTQGRPVSSPDSVRTLLDSEGRFLSQSDFKRRVRRHRIDTGEMKRELQAQYREFVDIAGPPDFWNSHQHIHVWLPVFRLFLDVARECGIRTMRCNRRVDVPHRFPRAAQIVRHPVRTTKGWVKGFYAAKAEQEGFRMPKGLIYSPGYVSRHAKIEEILRNPALRPEDTPAELMVHPATGIEPALFGEMLESRLVEYAVLRDGGFRERLKASGILLCNFSVLDQEQPDAASPTG
ncbi:ChbG/HpnK family deacetylase [Candidatus Sumerlaeota bacterium]|nr:ChbG/HpnK family deacetylase [Candidatus Sumerlaeota bacterium]